jgi:hypothetical protein
MLSKTITDTIVTHVSSVPTPFDKSVFEVASATIATAIVLFFTLALIPIQQCAATYSPSLLKYLKRDRVAIASMVFLLICLSFNIYMLLIQPTKLFEYISAMLLAISFICIIFMWFRIIRMLNPAEYLLPKIKEDCIKTIKNGLKKPRELTPQEQLVQLEQQMKKIMLVGEKIDPKKEKWAVPRETIDQLIEKIGPLKTVSMKLMQASDYETFEKAVDKIGYVSVQYFKERKDYRNPDDDFLFWLCEALQDLVRMAGYNPNVYYSRKLFTTIKTIALSTLSVKVHGYTTGRNDLTHPFSGILKNSAEASILKADRDRAYDAVVNLGHIAEVLAATDFSIGAGEIASEIVRIAQLCQMTGETVVPVPLRRSLAEIFFFLTYRKRLSPFYDLPYKKLIEAYEIMINIPVPIGMALSEGDPLFGWNPDLMRDRSLSALVYASLFSPNHDDNGINHNLDGVESIIGFLQKYHDKDVDIGWKFTDLLYQIGLWLLAFIDKDIQMELTLLPSGTIPTEQNQRKAKGILVELMKYTITTYFECLNGKKKNIFAIPDVLHAPFSLLYLALHLDRKHSLSLTQDIDSILELLEQELDKLTCPIDYSAYQSFQIFCEFLKRIDKLEKANTICEKTKAVWNGKYDASPLDIPYLIKRPIVTFNYDFISQLDTEIFGPKRSS